MSYAVTGVGFMPPGGPPSSFTDPTPAPLPSLRPPLKRIPAALPILSHSLWTGSTSDPSANVPAVPTAPPLPPPAAPPPQPSPVVIVPDPADLIDDRGFAIPQPSSVPLQPGASLSPTVMYAIVGGAALVLVTAVIMTRRKPAAAA